MGPGIRLAHGSTEVVDGPAAIPILQSARHIDLLVTMFVCRISTPANLPRWRDNPDLTLTIFFSVIIPWRRLRPLAQLLRPAEAGRPTISLRRRKNSDWPHFRRTPLGSLSDG